MARFFASAVALGCAAFGMLIVVDPSSACVCNVVGAAGALGRVMVNGGGGSVGPFWAIRVGPGRGRTPPCAHCAVAAAGGRCAGNRAVALQPQSPSGRIYEQPPNRPNNMYAAIDRFIAPLLISSALHPMITAGSRRH